MIVGNINHQRLKFAADKVVADSNDYLQASFSFSEDWDGFVKVAHFHKGDESYDYILHDDKIEQDAHLNLGKGTWEVYLHGNKGDTRITTDVQELRVFRSGVINGAPIPEIPLTAAEQILQLAVQANEYAEAVKSAAEAGAFDGKDYDHSEEYEALTAEMASYRQQVAADRESIADSTEFAQAAANDAMTSNVNAGFHELAAQEAASSASGYATSAAGSAEFVRRTKDEVSALAGSAAGAAAAASESAAEAQRIKEETQEIVDGKTEKVRIDFDGRTFKLNGETLNYKRLYDIHLTSPDFAFVVYGDRAYLLSYVQDDPGMKEMRFQSTIAVTDSAGFSNVKTSGIYVTSSDGVNIASVRISDINSENVGYKTAAITEANKTVRLCILQTKLLLT